MNTKAIVVMGVSGCGKSTIGALLAQRLDWQFADADSFHPQANIDKMRAGNGLTDQDRQPWLTRLNQELVQAVTQDKPIVLACSALKQRYRDTLASQIENQITFVHLTGSYDLIEQRMKARNHAYMPSRLLKSQFELLETPVNAISVSVDQSPNQMIQVVIDALEVT